MTEHDPPRSWPWVVSLLLALVVPCLTFATQQGQCFDAAAGAGNSFCSSGPAVGWPGAWAIAVACAILFIVSVTKLLRRRRSP